MNAPRSVRTWLSVVFGMIILMTALGGTTRLTGSGLSMVEWRPLMGALPPIGETEWRATFALYKQSPQYLQVNTWMTLADFQRIFFWEYFHRLMGRGIGLVVGIPWVYFLVKRRLSRDLAQKTLGLFLLGGLQGLMGWFMVMSGLVDEPRVSHLRLAAHLLLAFTVAQATLGLRLSLDPPRPDAQPVGPTARRWLGGLIALLFLQSGYGAFMAGTHAGWFSSTFPDVNGHYLPLAFMGDTPRLVDLVMNPGAIHATHRLLAWSCIPVAAAATWALLQTRAPQVRRLAWAISAITLAQVALGAAVVILHVPTALAVGHQVLALILLSVAVAALQRGGHTPQPTTPTR